MKKLHYKSMLLFCFIILFILIGNFSFTQNEENTNNEATNNTLNEDNDNSSTNESDDSNEDESSAVSDESNEDESSAVSDESNEDESNAVSDESNEDESNAENDESNGDESNAVSDESNEDKKEEDSKEIEIEPEIYSILNYACTGDKSTFNSLPPYLKNAVYFSEFEDKSKASKNVFRYIKAEDINKMMTLLTRDAKSYTDDDSTDTEDEDDELEKTTDNDSTDTEDEDDELEKTTYDGPVFDTDEDLEEVYEEYDHNPYKEEVDDESKVDDEEEDNSDNENDDEEEIEDTENEDTETDDDTKEKQIGLTEYEKSRIKFVMQLTGIKYNDEGFPLRNEQGKYIERFQSKWMKKEKIKQVDVVYLTEALLQGLYNKDPMVRITCLTILKSMGPHPMMLPDLLKATGQEINLSIDLDREKLNDVFGGETVGNIDRAFYIQKRVFGHVDDKNTEKTYDDVIVRKILKPGFIQEKYEYIDVNGEKRKEVPFLMFRTFLFKLLRLDIVYKMEKDKNFDGLKSIRKSALESLTQDVNYLSNSMYEQPQYDKIESEEEKEQQKIITSSNWSFIFYNDKGNENITGDDNLAIKFLSDGKRKTKESDGDYKLVVFEIKLDDDTIMEVKEEVNLIKNSSTKDEIKWKTNYLNLIHRKNEKLASKEQQQEILNEYELELIFNKDLTKINKDHSRYRLKGDDNWLTFEAEINQDSLERETKPSVIDSPLEKEASSDEDKNTDDDYNDVPISLYIKGISAFKYLAGKSLLPYKNVDYSKMDDVYLTKSQELKIVKSLINGLKNKNFFIRVKIAGILYDIYNYGKDLRQTGEEFNHRNNIKKLILQACISSQEMRNTLYEEIYILYESDGRIQISTYLNKEDSDKLKAEMGL